MEIRPPQPAEREQAFHLRVSAFSGQEGAPYDDSEIYAPDEHRLVAVDGDRVVGHLAIWPVQQAFAGRAVAMGAVSGFTIAADQRGTGIGSKMLAAAVAHMADAGMPISSLYPSTPVFYRRWGWEFAGVHLRRRMPTRALLDVPAPTSDVRLRPYTDDDLDAIVDVHTAVTTTEPGGMVNGRRRIARLLQLDPDDPMLVTVAERDGHVVGLMILLKTSSQVEAYGIDVQHLVGVDRDVERALLRSVGHHHTVAGTTVLRSRPADPMLFEVEQLTQFDADSEHFMTRMIDARAAVAARGWPDLTAAVALNVSDERVEANDGRFVLEIAYREALLTPGGSGLTTLDVGALAALYTGFASATQLAAAGRLRGPAADIDALDQAFAGPAPFMRDTF